MDYLIVLTGLHVSFRECPLWYSTSSPVSAWLVILMSVIIDNFPSLKTFSSPEAALENALKIIRVGLTIPHIRILHM